MQRYYEYSKEELTELSNEQVQALIDLEIAYAGVLPVLEPQLPEMPSCDLTKSVELYDVGGILFANRDEAKQVLIMDLWHESYDYYGAGYDYKYAEKQEVEMKVVKLYKKEDVMRVKALLTENKRLKEKYDTDKKEYDKYAKETANIRESVRSAIDEAWTWKNDLDHARLMYDKYLRLADGNEGIAQGFFRDAFKVKPDIIEALFPTTKIEKEKGGKSESNMGN